MAYIIYISLLFLMLIYFVDGQLNCGRNEAYRGCQPCAAINCGDPQPDICIKICTNPGCYCQPGYLRRGLECVPEKNCAPGVCGRNEIYRECRQCAAINCGETDPEICSTLCEYPGCYCQPGFLRKYGVCIPEKLCDFYAINL